jgi:hypothetical protein
MTMYFVSSSVIHQTSYYLIKKKKQNIRQFLYEVLDLEILENSKTGR